MSTTEYTVDYFIQKFEAIAEDKWCVMAQINIFGQRCALGHCIKDDTQLNRTYPIDEPAFHALLKLSGNRIAYINNGGDTKYQHYTPKQRVLAYLHDIKAKQTPPSEATLN